MLAVLFILVLVHRGSLRGSFLSLLGKRYLSAPVPKKVKHHGKPGRVSIEAGKGNQATMEPYRFWSHI